MPRLGFIEIFLIQFVVYIFLWMINDYLASMLTITFAMIAFFILLISLVAELIERSRVPRWYFVLMIASILAPLAAGAAYLGLVGGNLAWMEG